MLTAYNGRHNGLCFFPVFKLTGNGTVNFCTCSYAFREFTDNRKTLFFIGKTAVEIVHIKAVIFVQFQLKVQRGTDTFAINAVLAHLDFIQ